MNLDAALATTAVRRSDCQRHGEMMLGLTLMSSSGKTTSDGSGSVLSWGSSFWEHALTCVAPSLHHSLDYFIFFVVMIRRRGRSHGDSVLEAEARHGENLDSRRRGAALSCANDVQFGVLHGLSEPLCLRACAEVDEATT